MAHNESGMANINHTPAQTFGRLEQFQPSMAWNNYKERMEFYFEANGITNEASMRAIFLSCVGEATYEVIRSLLTPLTPKDASFYEIMEKLDGHFHPKPNEIVQRFTFHKRCQRNGETVADFVKDLRRLSEHCEFSELDKMLRDQIVCGVADESLQKRLFSETKLDFKRTYEIAVAHEAAHQNVMNVRGNNEVMAIATKKEHQRQAKVRCFRCEGNHFADKCFFREKNCEFCHLKGHSSKACFRKRSAERKQLAVHAVEEGQEGNSERPRAHPAATNYFYDLNNIQISTAHKILTNVCINGVWESFEVDSGAACTVISEVMWKRINHDNKRLIPSTIMLQTYSREKLQVRGSSMVNIQYKNKNVLLPVVVVAGDGRCLLGRDWFTALGITVQGVCAIEMTGDMAGLINKYSSVFTEKLGANPGPPISLELLPGSVPLFLKHRQCPIAWKPAVEKEIEKLVQQEILEPVMFSRWATPIVPVAKADGAVRICGDYRSTVNAVIKPNSYPLPLFSEVMAAIAGGTIFSKLDLQQAYQQLVVDEFSAELLTLNTHKGLFKVKKLPFGVSAAPGLFQKFMDSLLAGIDGVKAYLDDILISGKDDADHLENLEKVFKKLSEANLTVNRQKCLFAVPEIDFLGFHINGRGISPNRDKVRAIQHAPAPKNKEMLQSFLGLLNFYNAFLPQKASKAEKLHRLLEKSSVWEWTDEHERVFNELKALLNSDSLLIHYDPSRDLVLSCDASPYGVGAVLAHRDKTSGVEKPIAFASRTLGVHERNYAHIDKEALAIIFVIKHFHQYVAGREITIITDHKPLLGIFNRKKQISQMLSPRMLRWCLLLSAYNYQMEHRPGVKNSNADCMSRLPLNSSIDDDLAGPSDILMLEGRHTPPLTSEQMAKETSRDPVLSRVIRCVLHGWCQEGNGTEDFVPYLRRRTELSTHKGCLLWGSRVVVPPKYRPLILELLHAHHTGVSVMKAYARSYVWWPKLDQQIELKVQQCTLCQTTRHNPPVATPQIIHPPEEPWSTLHVDFAGPYQGCLFLVVVDSTSKWLEVKIVKNLSSTEVKHKLREIFATHGIPSRIISDNGTAFTSTEMQDFYIINGIKFNTTAPYHPASNGQAERMVQYLKASLKTMTTDDMHTRIQRILFKQHTTPNSTTGKTPAEVLMNRRLRINLDNLHPDSRENMALPSDVAGEVKKFNIGDLVYFRNYSKGAVWLLGEIIELTGPVSYVIRSLDNKVYRRHIDQLKRRVEPESLIFVEETTTKGTPVSQMNKPPIAKITPPPLHSVEPGVEPRAEACPEPTQQQLGPEPQVTESPRPIITTPPARSDNVTRYGRVVKAPQRLGIN